MQFRENQNFALISSFNFSKIQNYAKIVREQDNNFV